MDELSKNIRVGGGPPLERACAAGKKEAAPHPPKNNVRALFVDLFPLKKGKKAVRPSGIGHPAAALQPSAKPNSSVNGLLPAAGVEAEIVINQDVRREKFRANAPAKKPNGPAKGICPRNPRRPH